ncbi:MAG: hypothetical protein H2040_10745 [Euryhalocaulis sp.]|uniref:beta strand repeat-containing protein n=1 Tax=Euryhalocaulis sp. TaxID=2744307 RepID=UPI0017A67F45|nr:hypothetical protein [Euryhalocaulis sp.]MBA4802329.1 hypothetical protein [Euryhalocaulis sp.]
MAFTTAQDFIDVWQELDAAYVTFPAIAGAGGNYQDETVVDTSSADFDSVLAQFPEYAHILSSLPEDGGTAGELALAVNLIFVALAEAYLDYLQAGGEPILDIAKDRGGEPAPGQSYHDNILGNLLNGAIEDRFESSSSNPANNVDVTGDDVGDLVAEPRSADGQEWGDRPYFSGSSNNEAFGQAIAWDIAHGIDPSLLDLSRNGANPMDGEIHLVTDSGVTTFGSIQDAIDAASDGDSVVLGPGTYTLTSQLTLDKGVALLGSGEGATTIETHSGSWGILVTGDNASIEDLTVDASNTTHYGVKVQADDSGDPTDALIGFSMEDVTVQGAGRSEIDFNGVDDSSLTNVTADGQGTSGVGIALSDSTGITLTDITTTGNNWGSIGLYSAGNVWEGGTNNVTFSGSYSATEAIGIYADEENGTAVEDIDLSGIFPGTVFKVENSEWRDGIDGRSDDFTFFFGDQAEAAAFATSLTNGASDNVAHASVITTDATPGDVDAETGTTFIVANGMSIQAAIDAASDGDTIQIEDGVYAENLTIDKALTLIGSGGVSIEPASGTAVTITAGVDGDISFDGINLDGNGSAGIGIDVAEGANVGTLSFTNGAIDGFTNRGIYASDDGNPVGTPTMAALVVMNATFAGNGTGSGNTAHIKLFGFSGDATFDNVTFEGTDGVAGPAGRPDNAIEIIGFIVNEGNANPVGADAPDIGNITLTDVTVTGEYHKNPIAFFNFSEIDGLSISGLDLSAAESNWGPLFNLDGFEDADLDASVFGIIFPDTSGVHTEIQGEKTGQDVVDSTITGTSGNDSLHGKDGNDTLYGQDGDDRLFGGNKPGGEFADGEGNDALYGGAGADGLYGGLGDDVLNGGADNDNLFGGAGNDTAVLADNGGAPFNMADFDLSGLTVAGGAVSGDITGPDGTDSLDSIEALKVANTGSSTFIVLEGMSIQAAVDAAAAGDTIIVGPGTYDEDVVITKSLTLVSSDGAGSTIINGQGGALGAIEIDPNVDDVVIGGDGQGFTILGNNGNGAIENAAVYLQGDHDNILIEGNVIEARGDAGLLSEYSATVTNVTITGNEFTGQTFEGSEPGGYGFGDQFTPGNNVPRQLVTIGGNGQNSSNIIFTDNTVSGTAGGTNSSDQEQGNTLVTIDAADSTISGNLFTGFTTRFATALRAREPGTDINDNVFDASIGGSDNTAQIYIEEGTGNLDGNQFVGSANNDLLQGGAGDDSILAGDGDDYVFGSDGADFLNGQGGFNGLSYAASASAVDVRLWRGGEQTGGDAEGDVIRNFDLVIGSSFNDVLQGDNGMDVTLDGLGGDDLLTGYDGNDNLYGGAGDDRIVGRLGDDFIEGGAGADNINGGGGSDTVSYASSSAAVDVRLFRATTQTGGDAEGDLLRNVENIIGSDFNDVLQGDNGIDSVLEGGAGNDALRTYDGNDVLNGGDGNDSLRGGAGDDSFIGGDGNDQVVFTGNRADYTIDFEAGTITDNNAADGDDGSDTFTDIETLVFADQTVNTGDGPVATEGDDHLVGDESDDVIDGLGGDDFINGNAGNDTLSGGAGDDVIVGRNGDDLISGGAGADILKGDHGFDTVDYSDSDEAVDVRLYRGNQLGGDAEGDILRTMEGVIGSEFDDLIRGDDGKDVRLDGRGGDDYLVGYDGDDTLYGGDGEDRLIGDEGNDFLQGGAGSDIINGRDGVDTADYSNSSAGVDVRLWRGGEQVGGDAEGDLVRNVENITGSEFNDTIHGDNGLDSVLEGLGGDDVLVGFDGNDTLSGGDGDDKLIAREGDDVLDGGAGNDVLRGLEGADTFVIGISGGRDTIADFEDGVDVIDLTAFAVSDVSELTISQNNNVTIITGFGDDGEMLRLVNVDQGDIDNSDFLFGA